MKRSVCSQFRLVGPRSGRRASPKRTPRTGRESRLWAFCEGGPLSSAHSTRSEVSMATAAEKTRPATPAPARRLAEHPFIYEVNTWVWLEELRARLGEKIDLAGVPKKEWDAIAALGFDAVWLMGVWERSPAGIAIALRNDALLADFERALPGFATEDVVGSPYCVRDYTVAGALGGPEGLASAREALAKRGLGLILDFVPNHVAPDHPWTASRAECFVTGTDADLREHPEAFLRTPAGVLARGRDPYFPPWPDVVQLDAFSPALRDAVAATLIDIGGQCD